MSELIGYASRTGTRKNLKALRDAGWRLLVSAASCLRSEGFQFALDNGAWSAFQKGQPFDERAFSKALLKLGGEADWVVVPDIVMGGQASLDLSLRWLPLVKEATARSLIAVQDGFSLADIEPLLGPTVGVFVGGSTEWKEQTMSDWAKLCVSKQAWCHVGRVNSRRRINLCLSAGANSFDGTSASRFAKTVPLLDAARRQQPLFTGLA